MAGVHKTTVHAYIQNGICRADKQFFCHLQPIVMKIFHRRYIEDILEAALDLSDADTSTGGYLLQTDFLIEMPMEKI